MAKRKKPNATETAAIEAAAAAKLAEAEKERRGFIETLAGLRLPPETIGLLLVPPLSAAEIKANYARELEVGPAKVDTKIANGLLAYLEKNDKTVLIFLSKVFLGWHEKGSEQSRDPVPEPEMLPPTRMPSAKSLSEKILPFQRRSSPKS